MTTPGTRLLAIKRLVAAAVVPPDATEAMLADAAHAEVELQLELTKAMEEYIPLYQLSEIAGKARVSLAWRRLSGESSGAFLLRLKDDEA